MCGILVSVKSWNKCGVALYSMDSLFLMGSLRRTTTATETIGRILKSLSWQ